ncbi:MAG: hypothetical protein J6K75_09880 [Erysipelotrichaceae bacterium]|nr:hypothetical protein [Erysipelotrichaceae bacterium]
MAENKGKKNSFGPVLKEMIRKLLVSLKRNPQIIPLIALTISLFIFTFNLTDISNTTAKIYGKHMGLCAFVSLLLSILSYVCMFSAYPKRKKPNLPLIVLMLVMYSIIIFADLYYYGRINAALTREVNPIVVTPAMQYIYNAQYYMVLHVGAIAVTMVCVVLEPLFAKLLRKINTSVEVEENAHFDSLDISSED